MELVLFKNQEQKTQELVLSLDVLFQEYDDKLDKINELSNQSSQYGEVITYFLQASELRASNLFDAEKAKKVLNSEMWQKVIAKTNVLKYMPAEDRNQWNEDIREYNTPDFDKEIVIPTIQNLLLSQDNFFAKKVDGVFRNLSGEHLTNSPSGFRKKMIISNIINYYGSTDYDKCEYINDLRFILSKVIGIQNNDFEARRTQDSVSYIIQNELYGKWFSLDGGLLRMKVFKKGTAHLEIFPSVAIKLNQILSTLYPMAIPSEHRTVNKKIKEFKLIKDFLSSDTLGLLSELIDKLRYKNSFLFSSLHYKKETVNKIKEIIQLTGGKVINDYVTYSYDPRDVLIEIHMQGYIPDRQSHQFYPTEDSLAELCSTMIGRCERWDTVLEPSAGSGALLEHLNIASKSKITCLDISKTHCSVLKEKGFNVECMDFMKYSENNKFSKIIMNPPFTKNQAKNHVEKALNHLTEEGKLVAIIPSSLKDKIVVSNEFYSSYSETIEDAFLDSNTKVSVVIFKAKRKKNGKE